MRQDVRFFGFVPHGTLAALYRLASVFAFPSLYEGFGLPPARGDGLRHARRHLAHLLAARGGGRRRAARRPLLRGRDRAGPRARPRRRRPAPPASSSAGCAARTAFSWERSVRSIHAGYMRALGRRVPRAPRRPRAEGRPRPRLADRHARRREGPPLARPPLPRRADLHPAPREGLGRPRARGARHPHLLRPAPARRRDAATATTCRSSPRRRSRSTSRASTSSSRAPTAWPRASGPRPARCTSATATRRCATSGTATTTTSARAAPLRWRGSPSVSSPRACAPGTCAPPPGSTASPRTAPTWPAASGATTAATPVVIPPPVDTTFFTPGADRPGAYDLVVSALAPYKRLELVLDAYRGTGWPLRLVGQRPGGAPGCGRWPLPRSCFLGRLDDEELREQYRGCRAVLMPGVEDVGHRPPRGPRLRPPGGRLRRGWRARDRGRTGERASSSASPPRSRCGPPSAPSKRSPLIDWRFEPGPRRCAARSSRSACAPSWTKRSAAGTPNAEIPDAQAGGDPRRGRRGGDGCRVARSPTPCASTWSAIAWILPVTKGVPDLSRYLLLLPLMAVLWPAVLYFHGLYRIKRGRSRIDEFFAILFSVLIASVLTLGATLYVRVYYRYQPEVAPGWEYSQAVFVLFGVLDVLLLSAGRRAVRAWQERRWAAGEDVTRVVVAGTGELGRTVADALLAHRKLGYRVVGFLGEGDDAVGYAGPAGRGEDRRRSRGPRAQPGRPALRRPAPRGPRPARAPRQGPEQRVRRHQGRPRRRAVRHDQGRPRGPRRDPDHQPQRGAAPGLEQHDEAAHGRHVLRRPPPRPRRDPRSPRPRPARPPLRRQGARPPPPGAHDPRREDVPDLQVPHHGRRGGEGHGARLRHLGRPAPDADRRLAPATQPRRAARSSSTSSSAT